MINYNNILITDTLEFAIGEISPCFRTCIRVHKRVSAKGDYNEATRLESLLERREGG